MDMMYVEECCEILDSMRVPITASDREEGEYPYYGANGIQDYVADYIFDDELVLLAEDGGNFDSKERPIAYRVSGKCWVNNHAHVLKPKAGLDVDYLCYSLMFYKVDGMVNGATRQKLTQAAMRKMKIPSRSMNEQLHIVDELNRILKIKEQRQQELTLLDNLIKARFVEMFSSGEFPQVTIAELVSGKVQSVKKVFSPDDEIKYIDISSIDNKRNVMTGYTEYILSEAPSRAQQHIKKGDIVISTVRPNLRNVAMTEFEDDNLVASSGFCVLRASKCLPEYLLAIVCSDKFTDNMTKVVTGANYPAIKDSDIMGYYVSKPPMELQVQFAAFVHQIDKSKVAVQKALDETQVLFDSLMQKYFG